MWLILILFIIGTFAGVFFTKYRKFNSLTEKITSYAICLLLFFMGLSVGSNPDIMKNLDRIGWQSLIIAFFALSGSVLMSGILYYFFFRNEK